MASGGSALSGEVTAAPEFKALTSIPRAFRLRRMAE